MWLLEEHMRTIGIREKSSVEFWVPGEAMFGVKKYSEVNVFQLHVLKKKNSNVKSIHEIEIGASASCS